MKEILIGQAKTAKDVSNLVRQCAEMYPSKCVGNVRLDGNDVWVKMVDKGKTFGEAYKEVRGMK